MLLLKGINHLLLQVGNVAVMVSTILGPAASTCIVEFSYIKRGGAGGATQLKLSVVPAGTPAASVVWKQSADTGAAWRSARVGLGARARGWRLRFEGVHIFSAGRLVVDSIRLHNCSAAVEPPTECQADESRCDNGVCVPQLQAMVLTSLASCT